MRIDWFDGTVVEDSRSIATTSQFADEEEDISDVAKKPTHKQTNTEKKPIGFKRLLDISLLKPPILTLEVSHRPGFWNLLDEEELKGDFIVLIVKILASIYKSLRNGENSKIVTMLKTRLRNSKFLLNLKNYITDLPAVRIVEKRLNTHMWDDAEGFFIEMVELCEGILNFGGNSEEYLQNIFELLEATEISALGVIEEHSERFSNELFDRIEKIKIRFAEELSSKGQTITNDTKINEDPNSFRNLNIFPTHGDLLSTDYINLKPNIINGAYPNVEHYLDVQFKLLREDYFGPLRDGISKYMENPSKRKHENIRIHPKVRIIRNYVTNNKIGYLVDIAWKERYNQSTINNTTLKYTKQLMFGSLLLFTNDNFETILCATVLDSSYSLLAEGYIAVAFQNPVSNKIFSETYLMVESEVFFEPYHRVLKVLQNSRSDELPMKKYIVDVDNETQPPRYLNSDTRYAITEPGCTEEIQFPVLQPDLWPDESIGLDESQLNAYKFALTKEFAVIQGPPGTGKTFLGIKIASTLLRNLSLEGTPMLIICYTNHALDQFLEGLLSVTQSIVRLGSQSKSKVLERYSLHNARMGVKSKYSYLYGTKRAEIERVFKEMCEVQSEIELCEREVLSYQCIRPFLKIDGKSYELKSSKGDSVLDWLFGCDNGAFEPNTSDDWENLDESSTDIVESVFSEHYALKEIDSMLNSIKYVQDITDDAEERKQMMDKFKVQIDKVKSRLDCFKKYRALYQSYNEPKLAIDKVEDLYCLKLEQRWQLYYKTVGCVKSNLLSKMNTLLEKHKTLNQELEQVTTLTDAAVMEKVRVVGATTSAAARRRDLLTTLRQSVVIIEEAAEVLEAHIVASLTNDCQHLILIGDHKQLRPTAANYILAKRYNLEVSLFERMIRNGVHARVLTVQRRMRPRVAELLVPTVYTALDSHPDVYNYPDVRGMADNLYFFTHEVLEDTEGFEGSWSHRNTFEARWCVVLANYLRQMKYLAQEVTILSTYVEQVSLIKQLSLKYNSLRDIKITAVDNYQGEESRIVILSLVRSNKDGKIGFLNATNRICVALSRAREGFYIFGNMNLLKTANNVWSSINEKLMKQNAIGNKLTLVCKHHAKRLEVRTVNEFEKYIFGACPTNCGVK